MGNKNNLKPFTSEQSREKAKENGRKGGIASGKAKREKKLIKERILERMGETDWDDMIDGLIERAKETDKAFEVLRDTVGQKPTETVDMNVQRSEKLDDIFKQLGGKGLEE